ncbi:helix-turn-helix transcriptional regulator [Clostridium perfringens]|uniref:helix-turn-helix domain-containing protein n=1 Tax=Clostridium perfringens TaxID=1502 RepID=UPI001ABB2FAA|nr:helix-turn-helix transcriptional regulator [Clostridium perfringens]MBO3426969.1 helix-turn-helix transcriptional regulator [Clostridium perfringens]
MQLSYKKLWKLLIDRDLKKKDLSEMANVSSTCIAKLGRNENVNTNILVKICAALECDISDIVELTESTSEDGGKDE